VTRLRIFTTWKFAIGVSIIIVGGLWVSGCASAPATPGPNERPAATLPSDALSQLEIAFAGTPRKAVIRDKLDAALALYGLDPTEENYGRAGSALVAVRNGAQQSGCDSCTEIAILDQMLRDGALPGAEFPDAVAFASSVLATR
jgi:hypothetical protein